MVSEIAVDEVQSELTAYRGAGRERLGEDGDSEESGDESLRCRCSQQNCALQFINAYTYTYTHRVQTAELKSAVDGPLVTNGSLVIVHELSYPEL